MKVNLAVKNDKNFQKKEISFKGYKFVKSDMGSRELEVAYPFDPDKKDCYLEIFKIETDNEGNYRTISKAYRRNNKPDLKLSNGLNRIDLAKEYGIDDNSPFAYHFLLEDKGSHFVDTRVDAGEIIDERSSSGNGQHIFNVVNPNKSNLSKGGSMKLVIIDSQNVGYVYNDNNVIVKNSNIEARAKKGIKSITNKIGGTLAGVEHALDNGEYDSYNRIISLPVFTDDDFSAHSYWNKNCMQMASSLGNINNYASLQRKLFAKGMNFVSDGAFVNEGLMGVHFNSLLKWAEDSPYFYWFKASGLKDSPVNLGLFSKNHEFISHKLVNSPYLYYQDPSSKEVSISRNPDYNSKMPTYFQIFDSRLVSEGERQDTKHLIKTYSKMSTDNDYDMHTHNDSVQPYYFEIDPELYNKNIESLNSYNNSVAYSDKLDFESYNATRILSKFKNYSAEEKFESGFETWDANPDIAKLNFIYSNADNKRLNNLKPQERVVEERLLKRGNAQTQDYAVTSGIYWTQKTDDILRVYVAQQLKNIDVNNPNLVLNKINDLSNDSVFPKDLKNKILPDEVSNIFDDLYLNKRELSEESFDNQILEGIMNTPLDAIEFGDNIVSVLASPLVSKRANTFDEIGVPRYELFKNGNKNLPNEYKLTYNRMEKLYQTKYQTFAKKVLLSLNDKLQDNQKLVDGDEVTDFGKYVLPILTSEISKYTTVKSLLPKANFKVDDNSGEISYDYKQLKNTYLQTLDIPKASSPEDETQMLLDRLEKGLNKLNDNNVNDLVNSFTKMLNGTSAESFKLADLIIDKTQSGLDWRLDAVKDIGDIEDMKNGHSSFDYTWKKISDFWSKFAKGVISKNPNAYGVGELTDEIYLHNIAVGYHSQRYPKTNDIVPKFDRDTGLTSTANYSYFFSLIPKLFTKSFEDGTSYNVNDAKFMQKLLQDVFVGGANYIRSGSLDSIMYSYTFIGNHDKPRALHCLAMDMGLFYTDLNDINNYDYRKKAYQVVNDVFMRDVSAEEVNSYDFSMVSPKAVAMAYALRPALIDKLNEFKTRYNMSDEQFNNAFVAISKSICDLANGQFNNKAFNPDAFGIKPIDVNISNVIKQAKNVYHLDLPNDMLKQYENETFEAVMMPPLTKLLAMMKILVALPGIPTMFDGDDRGATGYDSKTKNMYLQGRQKVHEEWTDANDSENYKEFLAKFNKYFKDVFKVRKMSECEALNNGAVFTLPLNKAENGALLPSILRQSTNGKMAISIFNPTNLHLDNTKNYNNAVTKLNRLYFTENYQNNTGINGIKEGTKFVNANNKNEVYYTRIDENGYYYLTKHVDGRDVPIDIYDSTLILYHVPNNLPTFAGRFDVKPNMQFISKTYSPKSNLVGQNFSLYK